MTREKVMTFTGPAVSRHVTHSYSTLLTSLKFTYSYYLCFFNISLLSIADQPWLNMLGYLLNTRTWSYSGAWISKQAVWKCFSMIRNIQNLWQQVDFRWDTRNNPLNETSRMLWKFLWWKSFKKNSSLFLSGWLVITFLKVVAVYNPPKVVRFCFSVLK